MYDLPDARGHFGPYGGVFVAETLVHALDELRAAYERYRKDPEFVAEVKRSKFDLDPEDGAHLEALIKKLYATPKAVIERVSRLIK